MQLVKRLFELQRVCTVCTTFAATDKTKESSFLTMESAPSRRLYAWLSSSFCAGYASMARDTVPREAAGSGQRAQGATMLRFTHAAECMLRH